MPERPEYVAVDVASRWFERSHWTIRTWARTGRVRTTITRGLVHVHVRDVARQAATRPARKPRKRLTDAADQR